MTDRPAVGTIASSPARERIALALWLGIAALQIAVSFAVGGSGSDRDGEPFYDYSLAVGSLLLYGVLVALTFWIASLFPNRLGALGLRSFPARTLWLVAGVVIASVAVSALLEPILHAGREQGLEPEEWRSDRVAPFVVNAVVGGGLPAAVSAARAAANASWPSNSMIALVAIQMPERSGLPSAVRGTACSAAADCARSGNA